MAEEPSQLPQSRSPRTLWRIARERFYESVAEQAAEKRRQLNALKESVLGLVKAGKVLLHAFPAEGRGRRGEDAPPDDDGAGISAPAFVPITM